MNPVRRLLLQGAAVLAVGLLKPLAALAAWNQQAFGAKKAADALKGIGFSDAAPSGEVVMEAPEIAENAKPQDLAAGARVLAETLVALAGR